MTVTKEVFLREGPFEIVHNWKRIQHSKELRAKYVAEVDAETREWIRFFYPKLAKWRQEGCPNEVEIPDAKILPLMRGIQFFKSN